MSVVDRQRVSRRRAAVERIAEEAELRGVADEPARPPFAVKRIEKRHQQRCFSDPRGARNELRDAIGSLGDIAGIGTPRPGHPVVRRAVALRNESVTTDLARQNPQKVEAEGVGADEAADDVPRGESHVADRRLQFPARVEDNGEGHAARCLIRNGALAGDEERNSALGQDWTSFIFEPAKRCAINIAEAFNGCPRRDGVQTRLQFASETRDIVHGCARAGQSLDRLDQSEKKEKEKKKEKQWGKK